MSFQGWTPQMVAARNIKFAPKPLASFAPKPLRIETAVSLLAEMRDKETTKKATQLVRANRPKSEAEIQEEVEAYLQTQSHRAWWDRKRMDRATTSRRGVPDFVGAFAGKPFGLEIKKPGEKPTTDQLGELAWMRKAGAVTGVACSKDEAVEFFLKMTA